MDGFITWEILREYVSFVAIVFMVVEFTKELPMIRKIPTKYFSAIVAFLMILIVNVQGLEFKAWDIVLYVLSAISISLGSNGLYQFNKDREII